jgi:hypothetical protein
MTSAAMRAWLRRAARSSDRARLVLRGSLVTSTWCPSRRAVDVDHLVTGRCDLDVLRAIVAGVLVERDEAPIDEVVAGWGQSRGSRRKWEWLARKSVLEGDLPRFEDVRERVHARVAPILERARG